MAHFEGGGMRGRDERAEEFALCNSVHRINVRYYLTEQEGKAVQEILRRYIGEELEPRVWEWSSEYVDADDAREAQKDIAHINELAGLFE